ncbi:hypothetical protein ACFCYM_15070 [Streptomyces sp. NPDC056254]|uniref:hypothetical protein n=1 Tax=Streptomyces sp. NPDC056254 TaxID=3345763 RepID=UPI0035D7A967
MNLRRHTRTGLLAVAALLAGLTVGMPATATATATTTDDGGECAGVRAKLDRLEGRITPNACAFMKRQIAFGEAPSIQTYLDIFDPEASLWEAGGPALRGHADIGTSISRSLRLVPDLRYRGTNVVTEGSVMMFGQQNTVTLKGRKVSYPQIARNVLGDDGKTIQARRYYDRYELFEVLPDSERPRALFAGIADPAGSAGHGTAAGRAPDRFRPKDIAARLAAWNSGDAAALAARTGQAGLHGPGLDRPLTTKEGKTAYFKRLFERVDVEFKAGQAAYGRTTTYVEWHGTMKVGPEGPQVPFGIVERVGPKGEWELYFDTLPAIASQSEIDALFQALAS